MNPTTPAESHSHSRWWRPFDVMWLATHPLFAGFMEQDPEPGFSTRTISVEYPYKANLTKVLDDRGLAFAPYRATFVNAIANNEPCRILQFTYGEKV